jgi:hypothetical protein
MFDIVFEGKLSAVGYFPVAACALEVGCSFSLFLYEFLECFDVVEL